MWIPSGGVVEEVMGYLNCKYFDTRINPRLPKGGGYHPLKDYFPAC